MKLTPFKFIQLFVLAIVAFDVTTVADDDPNAPTSRGQEAGKSPLRGTTATYNGFGLRDEALSSAGIETEESSIAQAHLKDAEDVNSAGIETEESSIAQAHLKDVEDVNSAGIETEESSIAQAHLKDVEDVKNVAGDTDSPMTQVFAPLVARVDNEAVIKKDHLLQVWPAVVEEAIGNMVDSDFSSLNEALSGTRKTADDEGVASFKTNLEAIVPESLVESEAEIQMGDLEKALNDYVNKNIAALSSEKDCGDPKNPKKHGFTLVQTSDGNLETEPSFQIDFCLDFPKGYPFDAASMFGVIEGSFDLDSSSDSHSAVDQYYFKFSVFLQGLDYTVESNVGFSAAHGNSSTKPENQDGTQVFVLPKTAQRELEVGDSAEPSSNPSASPKPSSNPSAKPSSEPSSNPSASSKPSSEPSSNPSESSKPSSKPSQEPSLQPSLSVYPSLAPSFSAAVGEAWSYLALGLVDRLRALSFMSQKLPFIGVSAVDFLDSIIANTLGGGATSLDDLFVNFIGGYLDQVNNEDTDVADFGLGPIIGGRCSDGSSTGLALSVDSQTNVMTAQICIGFRPVEQQFTAADLFDTSPLNVDIQTVANINITSYLELTANLDLAVPAQSSLEMKAGIEIPKISNNILITLGVGMLDLDSTAAVDFKAIFDLNTKASTQDCAAGYVRAYLSATEKSGFCYNFDEYFSLEGDIALAINVVGLALDGQANFTIEDTSPISNPQITLELNGLPDKNGFLSFTADNALNFLRVIDQTIDKVQENELLQTAPFPLGKEALSDLVATGSVVTKKLYQFFAKPQDFDKRPTKSLMLKPEFSGSEVKPARDAGMGDITLL